MDFVSNQTFQIQEMLRILGINSVDELFDAIPDALKHPPIGFDDGLSEVEALQLMESIAKENSFLDKESYLGGGAYAHYIPALVNAITSRSEFLTSYTPYQSEASQGMLQATFEFQSAIAALTCMEVANAGVYDGACACAEAVLMALRLQKGKQRVLIAESVHPAYRKVTELYTEGLKVERVRLPMQGNQVDREAYVSLITDQTACVLIQSPNFFGILEEMPFLSMIARTKGALLIACGNPLAYALFQAPGEWQADIAVGDCQPLGLALNFGGPYAGYMACKQAYMRQLPGRIVGQTRDREGQKGFVLTLQAREQHIRREKATSNICTNQALATLASLITMLWYGPKGLYQLALTNYQRAHYLAEALQALPGFQVDEPFFNEFTLHLPCSMEQYLQAFRQRNIEPGIPVKKFYPEHEGLLVSVTELKSKEQLDRYVEIAREIHL